MTPQILIAGHIVKDLTGESWRLGGGALYAAAQASRLGLETAAVTACPAGVDPVALLPDVTWHVLPDRGEISFENRYVGGKRAQRVLSTARPIARDDIPAAWQGASIVLLTPVFHDVEPFLLHAGTFGDALVGVGAQGWLRRLDGETVQPGRFEASPAWLGSNIVFVSEEDVDSPERVAAWAASGRAVVLTRGSRGVTIWSNGERLEVSGFEAKEIDPTGAGDVFATAFLVRYAETRDLTAAAKFAAAAAALSVAGEGIEAVAGRAAIEARLQRERVTA